MVVGVPEDFRVSRGSVYIEISVDGSALKPLRPTGEVSRECDGSVDREEERERRL